MPSERIGLRGAALEIEPAPTDEERAAILAALERLLAAERDHGLGAWWAAGLADGEDDR